MMSFRLAIGEPLAGWPFRGVESLRPRISETVPVACRRHSSSWNKRVALRKEQVVFILGVDVSDGPATFQDFDGLAKSGYGQFFWCVACGASERQKDARTQNGTTADASSSMAPFLAIRLD